MKSKNIAAEPNPVFITPADLRTRWKVSGMFLWRKRRKGELTVYRFGERGVRFSLAEIEQIEAEAAAKS